MATFKLAKMKKTAKGRIVIRKQALRSKAYCEELPHRTYLISIHGFWATSWRNSKSRLRNAFNFFGEFVRKLKKQKLLGIDLLRLEALLGVRVKPLKNRRYPDENYNFHVIYVYHLQRIKTEKPEIYAIDYYELLRRMKKKLPDPSLEYLERVVDRAMQQLVKKKYLHKWDDVRVKIYEAVKHKQLFKPLFRTIKGDKKLKRLYLINEDLLIYKNTHKKWLKSINYIDKYRSILKSHMIWLEF
jgi:hypothetical protein